MSDPPKKEYQTYSLQEQKPVGGEIQNHLEYRQQDQQETNLNDQNGYQQGGHPEQGYQQQNYSQGYQQQGGYQQQPQGGYQQQYQPDPYPQQQPQPVRPAQPAGRALPSQPEGSAANPFRTASQEPKPGVNPFRQGFN